MSALGRLRSNWRIVVLTLLVVSSGYFLFVPGAPISGAASEAEPNASSGATNLQYGIQLAGGARITAPVQGFVAQDVNVSQDQVPTIREEVAASMGVERSDVVTSVDFGPESEFPANTIEVRSSGNATTFTQSAFVEGLRDAGVEVESGDVREGVTDHTRSQIVETLDDRLGESGFGGGSVTTIQRGTEARIQVEAPGQDLDELETLVSEQGRVQLIAHVPANNDQGYERVELLRQRDIVDVGTVQRTDSGQAFVLVTLTQPAATEVTNFMTDSGFSSQGVSACGRPPGAGDWCLLTVVDNQTVFAGDLAPGLANEFNSGQFEQSRQFRMTTGENISQAQELRLHLIAGELPAQLDMAEADQVLVNPALAEGFRTNSLLTGVIAVFAVVVTVFLRYGDPRVAVPMSLTALSEVVILLGFAAAIGWPLELAHVAGFVAVIGTGVDDLIIIADEVKAEGEVSSHRVFQSRFRKAFWVIGAAAATTIVAMSPLALMNLGDLRGFAIITILGVLIGVAVTRPAYGNILRSLTTGDH